MNPPYLAATTLLGSYSLYHPRRANVDMRRA